MRRAGSCLAAPLVGLLLLALAGCRTGHTPPPVPPTPVVSATDLPSPAPDPTSARPSPSPSRSAVTSDDLTGALLGPADLPGFQAAPSTGTDAPPPDESQFKACPELAPSEVPDTAAHAMVTLQKATLGPFISESLTATSVEIAKESVHGLSTVVDSCPSFTSTVGPVTVTFTLSPLAAPALGDQATAFRMVGTVHTVPFTNSQVVVVRVGGIVIVLINTVATGRSLDASLTRQAADLAVTKVQPLAQ